MALIGLKLLLPTVKHLCCACNSVEIQLDQTILKCYTTPGPSSLAWRDKIPLSRSFDAHYTIAIYQKFIDKEG